jgi:hypothetical protein
VPSIRGAAALALTALCVVAPAARAHEGNPNYRSEVRAVAPALPGLDARILNYDDRIELTYDGPRPLVVKGYRGEPYLRFLPGGRVELNRRSPAAYLNEDRFANVEVPGQADHAAPPDWTVVARHGRYDWHDHRVHWMSEGTLPPQVKAEEERAKVFDWNVPLLAAGRPASVRGTLIWVGSDEGGFPVAAGASLGAAILAGAVLIVIVRRRRTRGQRAPEVAKEAW